MDTGSPPSDAPLEQIPFEVLADDTRNLYHGLYKELYWKNYSLRTGHWYLRALATNGEECRRICSAHVVALAEEFAAGHGRVPEILDVGCGPISSLAYLTHEGLAHVVGVDAIAREYARLLERYDLRSPVEQVSGSGETLHMLDLGRDFDMVYCRNALDHTQCPPLTWLNMFNTAPVGGLIVQSHAIREGTKEGWKQLHQHDLYSESDGHLVLEDRDGRVVELTRGLPLSVELTAPTDPEADPNWTTTVYRKTGETPSTGFLQAVTAHLARTFAARSDWGLEIERAAFEAAVARSGGRAPLDIRVDTPGSAAAPGGKGSTADA